jgi:putative hemolysin
MPLTRKLRSIPKSGFKAEVCEMEILYVLLAMVILLLFKGFFSGSEIALVNSDKIRLHHKANQGHNGAKLILRLFKTPDVILGTTLVGTNISTVVLTTLGTLLMIRYFGERGDLYAFLVYTPLFLIIGEIVPKSVYQQKSDMLAPIIIYPLRVFSLVFAPIIFIFSRVGRLSARLIGGGKSDQSVFITRELVRSVVEMAERGSNVDAFDRGRIKRVIRFADTTLGEAMIPVAEMTAVNRNQSTAEAINLVRRRGYNRLPIYEGNISNVFGIVTLTTWDLMDSRFPISETNDVLGTSLPATESHTIGGLVMARLRHIPREGEFIEEAGYRFTVEKATERSVVKLRVERIGI